MKKRAIPGWVLKVLSLIFVVALMPVAGMSCGRKQADVHVFYYTYSDPFVSGVRKEMDRRFDEAGIRYQNYDGNGNQTTQTEQIRTAITSGAAAIVVNVVNTGSDDAAGGIVEMAKNAGIPVIFFNREVSDTVVNSYEKCAFVGTDAKESGILQGQMIGEYLTKNFDKTDLNGDGKISYILFKGEEGNNEAIYRTKYSVEEADKLLQSAGYEKLSFYDTGNPNGYLVDRNGQWSAAAANEYMTTALTSYNENKGNMIELVICNNDGMAEGAISALNTAGYNTGKEGSTTVPVFGVDATAAAVELIGSGKMAGTVKQDAEGMAGAVVLLAKNAVSGNALDSDLEGYKADESVFKIRIPYAKYTG